MFQTKLFDKNWKASLDHHKREIDTGFPACGEESQKSPLGIVVPQAVEDAVSKMKRSSYKISPQSSMNHQYAAMGYADGQEFDMRRRLEPSA